MRRPPATHAPYLHLWTKLAQDIAYNNNDDNNVNNDNDNKNNHNKNNNNKNNNKNTTNNNSALFALMNEVGTRYRS